MKKSQKGSMRVWIGIILVLILAVVGYFVSAQNSSAPTSSTNSSWLTYSNPEFGFQIKYPVGTKISVTDITGGRAVFVSFPQAVAGLTVIPFIEVDIQNQEYGEGGGLVAAQCNSERHPETTISLHGITFIKTDVSSDVSGMHSAAIAQAYCVMNNGIRYRIVTRAGYSRDSSVPDKTVYFPKFDEVVAALDFKVI
jgi:hypothetical protein